MYYDIFATLGFIKNVFIIQISDPKDLIIFYKNIYEKNYFENRKLPADMNEKKFFIVVISH